MFRTRQKALVWLLVGVMAAAPSLACAEQAAAVKKRAAKSAGKLARSYVTPQTTFVAVAHPRRVLLRPDMEMLPLEVLTAAGKKEFGVDPLSIEQVVVIAEAPDAGSPPGVGVVVRFSEPVDGLKLPPQLSRRVEPDELDGKPYSRAMGVMDFSIYQPNPRTVIVAHDHLLRNVLENKKSPAEGPMSRLLAEADLSSEVQAVVVVEPVRDLLSMQLASAPIPPPFAAAKQLPELLDSARATLSLSGRESSLVFAARDEAAAEEIEALIDQSIEMAKEEMAAEMAKQATSDDPVEQAMMQYSKRVSDLMFESLRPERDGNRLKLAVGGGVDQPTAQVAVIGILVALLLPAVQAAREAARRAQSRNNLKQIALAMHNYHDTNGRFPDRVISDDDGKPLLSWRVSLLPFLENEHLYREFRLDEPWDSPHNKELIPRMPSIYHNPSSPAGPFKASYLLPVGEGLFGGKKGLRFRDIIDGTSNTIMAVEANDDRAVIWTRPDDWECNLENPLAGLGDAHPGGMLVAFVDGSVKFLSKTVDPDLFRRLLTCEDGEAVSPPRF